MSNGLEIGTAYLSIAPSAEGIKGKLEDTLGGSGLSETATKIGDEAGGSFIDRFKEKAGVGSKAVNLALAGGITAGAAGLFGLGSMFDDAFDKIRVQTGETGPALEGLTDSFKNVFKSVPTDAGSASDAIGTLNQKLGLSGKPLEELSTQFLNLSRVTDTDLKTNMEAVTDAFLSFGISAEAQPAKLDLLYRASQQTGVSVSELAGSLATAGPNLTQLGLSFEESAGLLGVFGKAGVDINAVMPALSKSIVEASKQGASASDVFKGAFATIKGASSDTEAAGAAIDTFGAKAGPKLAGLIRSGKIEYEDFARSLAAGGDTINGAAADTADFAEKWNIVKNKALTALEPIASQVFGLAATLFDKVTPAFDFLSDHIGAVKAVVIPLVAAFVAYKAAMLGVQVATNIANAATKIWTATQAVFNAVMSANPIALVAIAIAGLVAGIIYAYTHFESFRNIVDKVGDAFQAVFGWIRDNWPTLLAILTGPIGLAVLAIVKNWDTIKESVVAVKDFIVDRFNDVVDFFGKLPGRIVGALGDFFGLLWDKGRDLITGLYNGINSYLGTVMNFWTGLGSKIIGWLAGAIGWLWGVGRDILAGLYNGIVSFEYDLWSFVTGIPGKIINWIGSGLNVLYNFGLDIVRGLRDGLVAGWHWVTDKVNELVNLIPSPVRKILGLNSPSKLFMGFGEDIVAGLVIGVDRSIPTVPPVMASLASAATMAVTPSSVSSLGVTGAYSGSRTGQVVQNFNVQTESPASAEEIASAMAFKARTAGV